MEELDQADIIAALQYAYKKIETRCCDFICVALRTYPVLRVDSYLTGTISDLLTPHHCLEEWLEEEKGISYDFTTYEGYPQYRDKMRVTRLVWINSLIEEFSDLS